MIVGLTTDMASSRILGDGILPSRVMCPPTASGERKSKFSVNDIKYPEIPNDEVILLNYTSGTTGYSKGVMLTSGLLR